MSEIWNELRPQLEFIHRPFPIEAVALACVHRDEVAPHLIAALEQTGEHPELADGDYMLHLYAMHLLAAWRDGRAYRPLLRLGHYSDDVLEGMMGDTTTDSYGRCLASVCDGDLAPLKALVEDVDAGFWARGAALEAMAVRVLEGDDDHATLAAYLAEYGDAEATRLRVPGAVISELEFLNCIANVAADIGAASLLEQIQGWFADGLLDGVMIEMPWIEEHISLSLDECRASLPLDKRGYVRDVVQDMGWWASFTEDDDSLDEYDEFDFEDDDAFATDTYVRDGPKIGRNDPCPCGSGKKYKKCHGVNA